MVERGVQKRCPLFKDETNPPALQKADTFQHDNSFVGCSAVSRNRTSLMLAASLSSLMTEPSYFALALFGSVAASSASVWKSGSLKFPETSLVGGDGFWEILDCPMSSGEILDRAMSSGGTTPTTSTHITSESGHPVKVREALGAPTTWVLSSICQISVGLESVLTTATTCGIDSSLPL